MKTLKGTLVVLVGLALAGCAGSSPENAGSSTPSAPPSTTLAPASATPTPQPSATTSTQAAAQGDPCTDPNVSMAGLAGVDFDRYANVCLGMSFTQASTALENPSFTGDAACPWYATIVAFDNPGFYLAAVTNPDDPGASIFMFRMTWMTDQASAIAFDAPATPAGITVGSTTADVTAAYPAAKAVSIDDPARGPRNQLVVAGPASTAFVFDVTDGFVTDIYWGNGVAQGAGGELCAL